MAKEETSLATLKPEIGDLKEVMKQRYIQKYADDVIKMMEEKAKLDAALARYNGWLKRVEEGDWQAVTEYKKERQKMEESDEYSF
jgi:hypothetical protein